MMSAFGGGEMGLLDGKRALVMGVANKRSIAWGIATAFQREGAELAFTYPGDRLKGNVVELVATLRDHERVPALARAAVPLFEKAGGGSIMSLTFNAVERVVPSYNAMAMAKAVLESETRYLAVDLGPQNIRVNCISAGPLKTLAASAAKGLSRARALMEEKAPLRRNITQDEVGNVAVFLASEWSRAVTGATIYADNGMNIVGVTN